MKKRLSHLMTITAILAAAACSTVNETTTAAGSRFRHATVAPESMIGPGL